MSAKDSGGPAFPQNEFSAFEPTREGMSLRDWFAGQALAGMMTNDRLFTKYETDWFARGAYKVADAMIAERNKTK